MKKKLIILALFIFSGILFLPPGLWALTSNKDIIVDDDTSDSPQIILRDQDEKTLTLQKFDTGEGDITNSEGAINIKPSTDTVHYLSLSTASNLTGIYWKGHYTNDPAIRINSSGELEYRDEDESTWTTLDSLAGGSGSGAPTDATYITQTANSSLSGEQALGTLASGILKNTTTTGILSIATAGTDYYNPGGTDVAVADGGTGTSNGSITGTTALTFTAGGTNQDVNLRPSGTGNINFNNTTNSRTSYVNQWGDLYIDNAAAVYTPILRILEGGVTPVRYTIFQGGDQTADVTYTLPVDDGTVGQVLRSDGSGVLSWVDQTSGAPTSAKYITQTVDGTLSAEQSLGTLATGILKNTTTDVTGVLSIAALGTDYYGPSGTDVAVADGGTGTSNGSITGTTALTFTAGGTNQDVNLRPSGTGNINFNNTTNNRTSYVNQWGDLYIDAAGSLYTNGLRSIDAAFTITEASARNIVNFTNSANTRTTYINQWGDIYTDGAAALYAGKVGIAGATIETDYVLELPNSATQKAKAQAWDTYSDSRVKTGQEVSTYGITAVMKLQPKKYLHCSSKFVNNKLVLGEGKETIGLIAQEVYQIIPEAVSKPVDENNALWAMDYNKLIPVLVKALQEQQTQIEELKKQVAELSKK
ncbi:MAG: tail fiber domain-containing protein [bacterium]|nr:tail fiber domain-containing protein [bacterium]